MTRTILIALATAALVGTVACSSSAPTEPSSEALRAQLATREARKWDLLFGTTAQRDTALSWFSNDIVNVGDGPTGITRTGRAAMEASIASFPPIPAGTFQVTEMQIMEPGDGTIVLSYRVTGPGPTGALWRAYAVSVWARRGGEWKTVFYQASPGAA